jgi:hypothetical protein
MNKMRTEHNLEQAFECTLVSADGRPATPRLERPTLRGKAYVVEFCNGPALIFRPDASEAVESPGSFIPFQWESFEVLGDEFRIVSEREKRIYYVRKA